MVKKNWKITAVVASIFLILVVILIIIPQKTTAQQVTCPQPKSFPAKGAGTGISPITAQFMLTGPISQVINTPETAQQLAVTDATTQCSSSLAASIVEAAKACATYCLNVPKCTPQASVNGPNICNSDNASCQQKTVLGSTLPANILNLIQQLIPIPNSQLMSSTVQISECNNKETSSVACECFLATP